MNDIIETAIKKIYRTAEQPDVAAVIEEVQLKCFNANTLPSHAADPATDIRHSQIMCFRSHSICAEQPIFANNLRLYSLDGCQVTWATLGGYRLNQQMIGVGFTAKSAFGALDKQRCLYN